MPGESLMDIELLDNYIHCEYFSMVRREVMYLLTSLYGKKSLVSFDYQEFNYSADSKYFLVQIFVHRIILLANDLYWQVPQWPWFEIHQRRQTMTLAMFGAFAEASCIVYIFLNIYDWSFIECVHTSNCRKQVKTYEDSDGNSADAGPLNGIAVRSPWFVSLWLIFDT